MRVGSLCAGIGGADLALEALGCDIVWHAEIDRDASTVLAHHWPDVPNVGDITACDWSSVEPVDVIVAGYPCPPFSLAGRRLGADDERHLWPAVRSAVADLRPQWVLLENVRGHLTLGFVEVLADLAAIGFDAEWGVLGSRDVGGCHRRDRLWVAAVDASGGAAWSEPFAVAGGGGAVVAGLDREATAADLSLLPTPTARDGDKWGMPSPGVAQARVDHPDRSVNIEDAIALAVDDTSAPFGRYQAAVDRWASLFGPPPPPTEPNTKGGLRLHAPFPEWMLGFPAGWVTDHVGRAAALRCIGNAIQPQTAVVAWSQLIARHRQAVAA